MFAASLLLVLLVAKTAVLAGRTIPLSAWSPVAYFWQDAAVVFVFAVAEAVLPRRRRALGVLYGAIAAYVIVNVPVTRVLSTPLTWPMLRAARGALADSILHYATWHHLSVVAAIAALAAFAPGCIRAVVPGGVIRPLVVAGLAAFVALGPTAAARVDTHGLGRNAVTALVTTMLPRIEADAAAADAGVTDWRVARTAEGGERRTLEHLRGAAAGRNVILVSLESTAAQYLGIYGARPDVAPHLSKLAQTGVVFDSAYAVYPESIKGLFSILCADYPAFDTHAEIYARVPCASLPEVLRRHGYRTALFHSGRFDYLGMNAVIRKRGFEVLADAGDIGGNHESSFGVDEPATVARLLNWIEAAPAGRPFFVLYMPVAGHHPYETPAPGPFAERDDLGRYRNALHYGDAALGALVRGIRERQLEERTLWVVLGDHGEAFGQHEGNYGHTFQLYDENVRVPFVIAAPGLLHSPIRSDAVVSLADTAPTVLDLIGVRPPAEYQGRSILDGPRRKALFFTDYSLGLVGVRDGPLKFIHETESGRSMLFDVRRDPRESVNIADRHPDRVRAYETDVKGWSAAQKRRISAGVRR